MTSAASSQQLAADRLNRFHDDGFLPLPEFLSPEDCEALTAELSARFEHQQNSSRKTIGGLRNVLHASPRVAALAVSPNLISLTGSLLGATAFPVRAIFFDKTVGANWAVPWHQDLAIAVAGRSETPGYGPWSVKEGVIHVQPPRAVLENMLALRLHLDDCSADNGALRVIPGSHRNGELNTEAINDWIKRIAPVVCEVPRGGALFMRPLLLHASSAAHEPSHRRVIHIEYAAVQLPSGLKWFAQ